MKNKGSHHVVVSSSVESSADVAHSRFAPMDDLVDVKFKSNPKSPITHLRSPLKFMSNWNVHFIFGSVSVSLKRSPVLRLLKWMQRMRAQGSCGVEHLFRRAAVGTNNVQMVDLLPTHLPPKPMCAVWRPRDSYTSKRQR